jgi:hypothetical protein
MEVLTVKKQCWQRIASTFPATECVFAVVDALPANCTFAFLLFLASASR